MFKTVEIYNEICYSLNKIAYGQSLKIKPKIVRGMVDIYGKN